MSNSLAITLSEPVVFLRTTDRVGRRHLVPADSPPSLVRGLLTLTLAKPTRISSIDVELQAKSSSSWTEGVGARRYDVTESHKILSASTLFFSAASTHATRRTASVGPGIYDDEGALEWEDHTTTTLRPPRGRSADTSIFQRNYISHHQDVPPAPSYRTHASSSSLSSNIPTPLATQDENSPYDDLHPLAPITADSDVSPPRLRPGSLPPPSSSSRHSSRMSRGRASIDDVLLESHSGRATRSHSRLPSSSHKSSSPSPSPSPYRKPTSPSRFTFSGFLGAVIGDRASAGPSNLRQESSGAVPRGRSTQKRQDPPEDPPPLPNKDQPTFRKFVLGELLGLDGDDHKTSGDGWKEFKKGTYTYPISFSIQGDSPPTLTCDHGSVMWRLKAHVHRPGAFRSKLTATRELTVISYPVQDDIEGHDNIVVERQWEGQMQYLISISARMFHIGGMVPVQLAVMPITKVKIYRLAVFLEERVDYYVQMIRIGRSDPIRRIELLFLKNTGKDGGAPESPILPLESDDVEAFKNSPLYAFCSPDDDPSEMASSLMGPGPWRFHQDLKLPNSCAKLRFTNKNKKSNISVSHTLKVSMRVERGDDREVDPKTGKKKLFDIIVQTPVHILSCRCNPEWISLPGYSESFKETFQTCESCPCTMSAAATTTTTTTKRANPVIPNVEKITAHTSSSSIHIPPLQSPSPPPTLPPPPPPPPPPPSPSPPPASQSTMSTSTVAAVATATASSQSQPDTLFRRNELFERLVSGQVSEIGEPPPAYASFTGRW